MKVQLQDSDRIAEIKEPVKVEYIRDDENRTKAHIIGIENGKSIVLGEYSVHRVDNIVNDINEHLNQNADNYIMGLDREPITLDSGIFEF